MYTRRTVLLGSIAALAVPGFASANDAPIELDWKDLVPDGEGTTMDKLRDLGVVQHGQMSTGFEQETNASVTSEYNGKLVRIPGYLVPLDFESTAITSALLVPYVGACIHVPPPPPNQLVFITSETPYESSGLFEPVYVTGIFGIAATETGLADVGYALSADRIEPYV